MREKGSQRRREDKGEGKTKEKGRQRRRKGKGEGKVKEKKMFKNEGWIGKKFEQMEVDGKNDIMNGKKK